MSTKRKLFNYYNQVLNLCVKYTNYLNRWKFYKSASWWLPCAVGWCMTFGIVQPHHLKNKLLNLKKSSAVLETCRQLETDKSLSKDESSTLKKLHKASSNVIKSYEKSIKNHAASGNYSRKSAFKTWAFFGGSSCKKVHDNIEKLKTSIIEDYKNNIK